VLFQVVENTHVQPTVMAEVARSSLVVPATLFNTLAIGGSRHKRIIQRTRLQPGSVQSVQSNDFVTARFHIR
jgi:hypothetical protein